MKKAGDWLHVLELGITKYKYAILVLLAGVLILSFSTSMGTETNIQQHSTAQTDVTQQISQTTQSFQLTEFEEKLQDSLSNIQGIGRVKLTLSLKTTEESVYAADIRESTQSDANNSYESALSIISDKNSGEQPILVKNIYPTFRGALVLCDGADSDTVRLCVIQAVSTICGLGTDKVSVLKMQG